MEAVSKRCDGIIELNRRRKAEKGFDQVKAAQAIDDWYEAI